MIKKHDTSDGTVWGYLTIIGEKEREDYKVYNGKMNYKYNVLVRCKCGTIKKVCVNKLTTGDTRSCGCIRKEIYPANKTHGMSRSREYNIWCKIKRRCFDSRDNMHYMYGAVGITMCERWRNSFDNFIADMGVQPSAKHSIDRYPNQQGNYEVGNCRWATTKQQGNNRKDNVLITINGLTKTMTEWCDETGVGVKTASHRIRVGKWDAETSVLMPAKRGYNGKN